MRNSARKDMEDLLYVHPNLAKIKKLNSKFVIVDKQQRADILTDLWNATNRISYLERRLRKLKEVVDDTRI